MAHILNDYYILNPDKLFSLLESREEKNLCNSIKSIFVSSFPKILKFSCEETSMYSYGKWFAGDLVNFNDKADRKGKSSMSDDKRDSKLLEYLTSNYGDKIDKISDDFKKNPILICTAIAAISAREVVVKEIAERLLPNDPRLVSIIMALDDPAERLIGLIEQWKEYYYR